MYLRSRQSFNGAFCFYRSDYVDEPNLHDTYHAVAALTVLGECVPRVDELIRFLHHFEPRAPRHLFYQTFTLDLLGQASSIAAERLARIGDLSLDPPRCHPGAPTSDWLRSSLQVIRLKEHFAHLDAQPRLARFVENLGTAGGFGSKPNLGDTFLCLSILSLLGPLRDVHRARAFVDDLQIPSFGFTLTRDSLVANLEVIHAGLECCALLRLATRYPRDIVAFTLASQTSNGGFGRAPSTLPSIELTHSAIEILARVDPDAFHPSAGAEAAADHLPRSTPNQARASLATRSIS